MKRLKHLMVDAVVISVAGGPLGGRKCGCYPWCHSSDPVTDTSVTERSTPKGIHLPNMITVMMSTVMADYSAAVFASIAPLRLILERQKDTATLYSEILKQASLITYNRTFDILRWGAVGMLPILPFVRPTAHVNKSAVAH